MEEMVKLGPDQVNGRIWSEKGNSKIVQILISHEEHAIKSIQFIYVLNGNLCRSELYGERHISSFSMVTFDYPSEFLTSVSVEYCPSRRNYKNDLKLVAIAFGTNKRDYGPFGKKPDTRITGISVTQYRKFRYEFEHNSFFGGFHGTVLNGYVNSVGVYVKPVKSLSELKTEEG